MNECKPLYHNVLDPAFMSCTISFPSRRTSEEDLRAPALSLLILVMVVMTGFQGPGNRNHLPGNSSAPATVIGRTLERNVRCAVEEVASSGMLCSGRRGEHRYTVWWMTRRAPVSCAVEDVVSTGTLCDG